MGVSLRVGILALEPAGGKKNGGEFVRSDPQLLGTGFGAEPPPLSLGRLMVRGGAFPRKTRAGQSSGAFRFTGEGTPLAFGPKEGFNEGKRGIKKRGQRDRVGGDIDRGENSRGEASPRAKNWAVVSTGRRVGFSGFRPRQGPRRRVQAGRAFGFAMGRGTSDPHPKSKKKTNRLQKRRAFWTGKNHRRWAWDGPGQGGKPGPFQRGPSFGREPPEKTKQGPHWEPRAPGGGLLIFGGRGGDSCRQFSPGGQGPTRRPLLVACASRTSREGVAAQGQGKR